MKLLRNFILTTLLCVLLSTSVLAAEGFNAGLTVDRTQEEAGFFTVTVVSSEANDAILGQQQPMLSVPCSYTYAQVINQTGAVVTTGAKVNDGTISFKVVAGGTYTVQRLAGITFDANGGTCNAKNRICGLDGKLTELPVPTRDSYTFVGWFDAAEDGSQVTVDTVFAADTTIYARWAINQYTVTYTDGVDGQEIFADQVYDDVVEGTTTPAFVGVPARSGYAFKGWTPKVSDAVTGDVVYTAQWSKNVVYVPATPSVPSTPTTSTETVKNQDGSTTTIVTNNKTGTVTETTKNADGSTITVETQTDGTFIEAVENADGSSVTTEARVETMVAANGTTETITTKNTTTKDAEGNVSTTTTTVTETSIVKDDETVVTETSVVTETRTADGTIGIAVTDETGKTEATVVISKPATASTEPVTLPIPAVSVTDDDQTASTVTVTTNSETEITVVIPVVEVSVSTVAIIVYEDGTETVIPETKMTSDGLVIDIPDGAMIKIEDNSIDFADVSDNDWERDAVDFASARGLVNGVGNNSFDLDSVATRAHVITLLARLSGVDTTPDEGQTWYDKSHQWAVESGITYEGSMNIAVSRQSMFTMIWRMLGCPKSEQSIDHFTDIDGLTQYTVEAARWAVEIGLVQGHGDGTMDPAGSVTRGQLAQFMMNFIQLT